MDHITFRKFVNRVPYPPNLEWPNFANYYAINGDGVGYFYIEPPEFVLGDIEKEESDYWRGESLKREINGIKTDYIKGKRVSKSVWLNPLYLTEEEKHEIHLRSD